MTGCRSESSPAVVASTATVVPVVKAQNRNLDNDVSLSAEFTPYQTVDVMSKVAGYVRQIRVDIGDRVRQGDVLATLEVPELQDEFAHAKAGLASADAGISSAQGALERAKAAADIAHLSYTRIQSVLEKNLGLVPRQEVDIAQSHDLEAKAQLASAQSGLIAAQQAKQGAQAEMQRANAMLDYATIRAPYSGVVIARYANVGSMIQAGISSQTQAMPVVRLAQNDLLRLRFPVPVTNVAGIRDGQPVKVHVTTLNQDFAGKVIRFADAVDMSTRTMQTEVDVPNPKNELIPGMYAQVSLNMAVAQEALSVPVDAIDGLGTSAATVYVVRDGHIAIQNVATGIQTPKYVQITSGLASGDTVIVGRRSGLSQGQPVETQTAGYE